MAPKNNKGGDKKGKGKDAAEGGDSKKGLKPATSINVRHILVCAYLLLFRLVVGSMHARGVNIYVLSLPGCSTSRVVLLRRANINLRQHVSGYTSNPNDHIHQQAQSTSHPKTTLTDSSARNSPKKKKPWRSCATARSSTTSRANSPRTKPDKVRSSSMLRSIPPGFRSGHSLTHHRRRVPGLESARQSRRELRKGGV